MAGGIFVDRPFHPNPKCIVFAGAMIAFYWAASSRPNVYLVPAIFVVAYVAMAWYDYLYDCGAVMRSGSRLGPNTFDAIFKPQRRSEGLGGVPDQERAYLWRVYVFHLLAVVPILAYVGYRGAESDPRAFSTLLALAAVAFAYHTLRLFVARETR